MLITHLPVAQIDPNPANPRRTNDPERQRELAQSVKAHGVLQPITARPLGDRYQVVCGHRRLEAVREAGLETVPAIVRELTDREALEIAIVENLQREDVPPLEEADAYGQLVAAGLDGAEIARRLGRTARHVSERLRLATLIPLCRQLVEAGHMTLGVALVLAELGQTGQIEAVEAWFRNVGQPWFAPPSVAQVKSWTRRFLGDLESAPFDVSDPSLPGPGPWLACPHNTGCQAHLFGKEGSWLGNCRDLTCYEAKRTATIDAKVKAALTANPGAVRLLGYGRHRPDADGLPASDWHYDEQGKKVGVIVAGNVGEQGPGDVVRFSRTRTSASATETKPEANAKLKADLHALRVENLVRASLVDACLEVCDQPPLVTGPAAALVLAKLAEARGNQSSFGEAKHKPYYPGRGEFVGAVRDWGHHFTAGQELLATPLDIDAMATEKLGGQASVNRALVQLVARDEVAVHDHWRHSGYGLLTVARLLGVDVDHVRAEAEAALAPKGKGKK